MLIEVGSSGNALDSNLLIYGWKVIKLHSIELNTIKEASSVYRNSEVMLNFLKTVPLNCAAAIMVLRPPQIAFTQIQTYGFPV